MTEAQAADALGQIYATDATRGVVRGQWVAQIASGQAGLRGATALGLLSEHRAFMGTTAFDEKVRLIQQGDWGQTARLDPPMWVTVVDLGATSAQQVRRWCDAQLRVDAQALPRGCVPRLLKER